MVKTLQVVPGRAGGGSFRRKNDYIAKKEFAYRMCARWPTIAMPKLSFWVWTKLLPLHGCDVMCFGVMGLWFDLLSCDVATYEVICGTTPVLLCTTKNYSSITLYYKVLLQYYSVLQSIMPVLLVLQSTTPVLLCTTKYYASTTKYYASTTTYYPVLQRTTPILLCTTKYHASTTTYYSSTTLYYKVLRQYYSVLQSTTPVLQNTTPVLLQYYSVLQSPTPVLQTSTPVLPTTTTHYSGTTLKRHFQCAEQVSHPRTSLHTAPATQNECHQWSASHMKPHFQCAEQVKSPSNLTKYCACHAKWMSSMICVTYETSFPMRGASKVTLQPHQILCLPRKLEAQDLSKNSLKCFRQKKDDSTIIRPWSEHNPRIIRG